MILTSDKDRRRIREAGEVIKEIFPLIAEKVVTGVSTGELDRVVEAMIVERGGTPAFKGYKGYPATICASVNDVVVHGIPSDDIVLKEGDIVGIDVGVKKKGFFADAARTFMVGSVSEETLRLVRCAEECLDKGIEKAVDGNLVADISMAIQSIAEREMFREVRVFVGHGIGKNLHEAPEVPNWANKRKGPQLREGMVLAIEPMINSGSREVRVLPDGWTAVTVDGGMSSHFENTVIVGKEKAEIIT